MKLVNSLAQEASNLKFKPEHIFQREAYVDGYEAGFRKALELAAIVADENADLLDRIKYELEASVYTLEDDEFGTVFFVRDCLQSDIRSIADREIICLKDLK